MNTPQDAPAGPLAALGVLSAAGASGQASGLQYLARRDNVRSAQRLFTSRGEGAAIALRFLLARPPAGSAQLRAVDEGEQRRNGDIVLINITESRFNCALKFLLWCVHCQTAFPTAHFHVMADDDTFIQLAHLEADLRTVPTTGNVLWGLVMWRARQLRRPVWLAALRPDATRARHEHGRFLVAGTHSTTTSRW